MGRIWDPKADKPLVFLRDYVVQEGKHHSTVVSIKKQEWFANTSVINSKSVEILEHLSQKGGGNAGFWGSPIKAGDVFSSKKTGRSSTHCCCLIICIACYVYPCFPTNWNVLYWKLTFKYYRTEYSLTGTGNKC